MQYICNVQKELNLNVTQAACALLAALGVGGTGRTVLGALTEFKSQNK